MNRDLLRSLALVAAIGTSGCTFGLGERASFVAENLTMDADLGDDGRLRALRGDVQVFPLFEELEDGVGLALQARDGDERLLVQLDVLGNLGALCPGAAVVLDGNDGVLAATQADGAPAPMLAELEALGVESTAEARLGRGSDATVLQMRPDQVVLRSAEAEGDFARMTFAATTTVDGQARVVTGSFDIARRVERASIDDPDNNGLAGWE
ncbi:MAG: hypothetical protein ACFCGT_27745 [Sandaracinaceae bacterium]